MLAGRQAGRQAGKLSASTLETFNSAVPRTLLNYAVKMAEAWLTARA